MLKHVTVVWHLLADLHMTYSACGLVTDQDIVLAYLII